MSIHRFTRFIALSVAPVPLLALMTWAAPSVSAAPRQAPEQGDCYLASTSSLDGMSNPYPSIDCALPHNLETYHVGEWRHGDPYAIDPADLWPLADRICGAGKAESFLGVKLPATPASRIYWYYFLPTPEQWADGERWITCEVGLQRGWNGLQTVTGTMNSLLQRQGLLGWAYCTKSKPQKASLQAPVPCASASRPWILADSTRLKGTQPPGAKKAGNEAAAFCKLVAQRSSSMAKPNWAVWWSSDEEWRNNGVGIAWCYLDLAETRWR